MDAEPQLREELAFCRLGPIPHSKFLGWDDADQAKAIAYERWRNHHCPHCRQWRPAWEDEDGKVLKDPPFEVVEAVCGSCEAIGYHEEAVRDQQKGTDAAPRYGVRYGFKRVRQGANDDVI